MRACVYKRVCNERLCVQMGVQSGVQRVLHRGVQGVQDECAEVRAMAVQGVNGECAKGRAMAVQRFATACNDLQ